MHRVRLLSVFAADRAGELARATKVLAEAGLNIRWVSIAPSEGFGVIKFLVDRSAEGLEQLRAAGFTVSLNEVLAVEVRDKPGGLHAVAEVLARHRLNITNASGFVISSRERAVLLIEVEDVIAAQEALKGRHLHLLTEEELVKL
jgi:hypothetical protein